VMENHRERPEVAEALSGVTGISVRRSDSTGYEQHYLALPPDDTGRILRVSVSEREVAERLAPVRSAIVWTSILVGLIGIGIVALVGRRLARPIEQVSDTTLAIAGGDLERRPGRSTIREIDELGLAVSRLADDLGERLTQSEMANTTLEVVLAAIPQGTILVGAGEEVVYANAAAAQMLGPIPKNLSGLVPHPLQTAVRECRESAETVEVTVSHGLPGRRLHGVATPFAGEERVLLALVDVTDRERAASVRRDFVANASHELKTPVSSIISSSEALTTAVRRGDESALAFAENIESAARRLNRMVSDLLDLSRLEREVPELTKLRLDPIVRDEVSRFAVDAGKADVDLTFQGEPVEVEGNGRDLAIVFGNLIENAIAYTPPGGSITVSVRSDGEAAVAEIADTGSGIPIRDLERIFERFYRVDAARSRSTGGTGLGLSIVKHSVEAHGGTVSATSELGGGSTFTVRLPLAP
jgi:two-component system, OmpR family, phosphate regulon sensor histidine kinase PhoR